MRTIQVPTFADHRGQLSVIDTILPFEIKRVYYIYHATQPRGGHRHHKTIQALICVSGSCEILVNNGQEESIIVLDSAQKCVIIFPQDWHVMQAFSHDAVLLVLASEHFDADDYIDEPYPQ